MYRPFPERAKLEARGRHPRNAKLRAAFIAGARWGYRERTEPVCGILFHDGLGREPARPVSFHQVREVVKESPRLVVVENVSGDGNGYTGELIGMPLGRMEFIGPDPWTDRQFRGWLVRDEKGIRVERIDPRGKDTRAKGQG